MKTDTDYTYKGYTIYTSNDGASIGYVDISETYNFSVMDCESYIDGLESAILDKAAKLDKAIDNSFHGAILVEKIGKVVLIKRTFAPHGMTRNFLITNHMIEENGDHSFYWSTYDLTLEEAVQLLNEKAGS